MAAKKRYAPIFGKSTLKSQRKQVSVLVNVTVVRKKLVWSKKLVCVDLAVSVKLIPPMEIGKLQIILTLMRTNYKVLHKVEGQEVHRVVR